MDRDKYITIQENIIGEGLYSEKRSKFLAFAHHIETSEEALEIVKRYKRRYFDARHCCYAYRIGYDGQTFRANDDGEPSSTAGRPILGQIDHNSLTNILVCVVRYYGGTNLGTSGLINAYREATSIAISKSIIVTRYILEEVTFSFTYPLINEVMKISKDMEAKIIRQHFDNTCEITFSIRQSKVEEFQERLNKLSFT